MVFIIKHIIALVLTATTATLYGYFSAVTASDITAVLLAVLYVTCTIGIYIYTYDTTSNNVKRLGVLVTLALNTGGLYLAWGVWSIIRSDYQLYLISDPLTLWNNVLSMAADANVILVHSRYPEASNPKIILYCYWIAEGLSIVALPTLFAAQAVTAYSDDKLSAEEIHHHFDSPAINQSID